MPTSEQSTDLTVNARPSWRARAFVAALSLCMPIVACATDLDDEDDLEFRQGCDGVDEYIDENGNYVVCTYADDDGGHDGGGGDPCWEFPWLCDPGDDGQADADDGGGEAGGGGGDGGGEAGDGGSNEVCWGTFTVGPFTRTRSGETEAAAGYDARHAVIAAARESCESHTSTFCAGAFGRLISNESGPCTWYSNDHVSCSYTASARCRWTF